MRLPLAPLNLLAVRAAVAAAAAIFVSHVLLLERSYWSVLVAVVVLNETWGASLERALQRTAMTVLGCLAGWFLHSLAAPSEAAQLVLLFVSIFLALYFRGASVGKKSYSWMMFFVSLYVVFLYAVIGKWSTSVVITRLYDTVIGAGIALAACLVILPPGARTALEKQLACFRDRCREVFEHLPDSMQPASAVDVLRELEQMRNNRSAVRYEYVFDPKRRKRSHQAIRSAEDLGFHLAGLMVAIDYGGLAIAEVHNVLDRARGVPEPALGASCEHAAELLKAMESEVPRALVFYYSLEVRRRLEDLSGLRAQ
jgi:uncharacterized membrane protein YccC